MLLQNAIWFIWRWLTMYFSLLLLLYPSPRTRSLSLENINGNKEISVQRDIILHKKVTGDETAEIRCRPPTHLEQKSQLKKQKKHRGQHHSNHKSEVIKKNLMEQLFSFADVHHTIRYENKTVFQFSFSLYLYCQGCLDVLLI